VNAAELEQAAAAVIHASSRPAAAVIADLLDHTAQTLHVREGIWDLCDYSPVIQRDLTRAHFGREIAIAQALTGAGVNT